MSASEELHPLVGGFDDAAAYDAGRPRYWPAVAEHLIDTLGLRPGAPVLELGAGTGQLSEVLLGAGLDLTAVEPLGPTRELLARRIGTERVREGRAEQIPIADGAVDAVLAADAFHWFDEARAMPEIRRVLAAGGGAAILRMTPRVDRSWAAELGELLLASRPAHPGFGERGPAAALEEDERFGEVHYEKLAQPASIDRPALLAWIASFSWVAMLAPAERELLLEQIDDVLARHGEKTLSHEVLAQIWSARLR